MRRSSWTSRSSRRVVVAAIVAQAAISFSEQGAPTLSILIKHDLALSATAAGLLVGAMGLGRVIAFYAAGVAVDRHGETQVLLVAATGAGAGIAAAAFAPYLGILICFLAAGVFLAAAAPAGGKLVFYAVSARRRRFAMGLRQAAVPIGGLAAAVVLPLVAAQFGWRVALVTAGVITASVGSAAAAAAGFQRSSNDPPRTSSESQWRNFATREFKLLTIWGCVLVGTQYALLTFFALDAQRRTGISAAQAAALLIVLQGGGIAGRIGWGLVADMQPALQGRHIFSILAGLGLLSLLALVLPFSSLGILVVIGFIAGVSINGWQGVWTARIVEIAGAERAGAVTGFSLTFLGIAITLSTPACGALADISGSYRAIWLALGIAMGGAMLVVALMPNAVRGPTAT